MADLREEGASIFRQSAMSRIASADDLDKYIKVTNPSAWIVLVAAMLLVGGLVTWSATAVIPTTVQVTGVASNNTVTCWVNADTANKIEEGGASARILDQEVKNITVKDMPFSAAEVKAGLGSDYLNSSVTLTDWNYEVTMETSSDLVRGEQRPVPISITVSETHPLDLVLGGA